jgi:ribosomal protein L24
MLTVRKTKIVEGVNMVSKHTKPSAKSPQGGIVKKKLLSNSIYL